MSRGGFRVGVLGRGEGGGASGGGPVPRWCRGLSGDGGVFPRRRRHGSRRSVGNRRHGVGVRPGPILRATLRRASWSRHGWGSRLGGWKPPPRDGLATGTRPSRNATEGKQVTPRLGEPAWRLGNRRHGMGLRPGRSRHGWGRRLGGWKPPPRGGLATGTVRPRLGEDG